MQPSRPADRPLFFHVKPGHAETLRDALQTLQAHPGYRPGTTTWQSRRFTRPGSCSFADDTRLLFATSFDGPWDRLGYGNNAIELSYVDVR